MSLGREDVASNGYKAYSFQSSTEGPLFKYSLHFYRDSYRLPHQPCQEIRPRQASQKDCWFISQPFPRCYCKDHQSIQQHSW